MRQHTVNAPFQISKTVKSIVIINVAIYIITLLPGIGRFLIQWGALVPNDTFGNGQLWRLLTYMFLHDPNSSFHLLFNMLALWMFSREIEELWGGRRFLQFYCICGIGAGCFSLLYLVFPLLATIGVIGASGAVLALLTVYAFYFPHREILLFFVFPVNIRIVVIGYALISLFGTISPHGVISHITHLGGIVMGVAYIKLFTIGIDVFASMKSKVMERNFRRKSEKENARRTFFEDQIDPILEKMSREGMNSITPAEKKILDKVSKLKKQNQPQEKKLIAFKRRT